jgi:hypothetical protein
LRSASLLAALAAALGIVAVASACRGTGSPSAANPAPAATATPTPKLPKTPAPIGAVPCALGKGREGAECRRSASQLIVSVEEAIQSVIQKTPEIFDLNDEADAKGSAQYHVLDKPAYLAGVLHELRQAGFCADLDYTTAEWIQLKENNDYSEDFAIFMMQNGKGYIRRAHNGSYRRTCHPASFHVDPDPEGPPPGTGCGKPYPPPITHFAAKVHVQTPDYWALDSTPLTGPDIGYCTIVGFKNRTICPLRTEGTPDRQACENWRSGMAKDTGKPGPTWTRDGNFCTGRESGCARDDFNPYKLYIYIGGGGHYMVCTHEEVCAELQIDR